MNGGKLKFALIGCGAVTELFHLPALQRRDDVEATVLVDTALERAQRLALAFDVPTIRTDFRHAIGEVDAAIVATPHRSHAAIAVELLEAGKHVLVEKPMAMSVAECDAMIDAARRGGASLGVGMQRRYCRGSAIAKQIIQAGMLGTITSFDVREGGVYSWPVEDIAMLRPEQGGGVLTGTGVHTLDLLLWWLGDFEAAQYLDDAQGGVEADAEFRLRLAGGAEGVVEFSRTRNLRNTFIIHGDKGTLEVGTGVDAPVRLRARNGDDVLAGRALDALDENPAPETAASLLDRQLADFVRSARAGRDPLVSGSEARRAVRLLEHAVANRQSLPLPWITDNKEVTHGDVVGA